MSRRAASAVRVGPVLLLLLACACPPRSALPDVTNLTDDIAVARVHAAAARRARLVGTVKAKLPGLSGMVMSADLDVALEPPSRLSVAVRSFFEQPMQMLVTNGDTVTIFDATQAAPVFKRGRVDARTVGHLLPIPLWPHEVVAVFLQRPSTKATGRLVSVDEQAGTYDVWLEPPSDAPFQVTVRAADDAIVRWQHFKRDGRPLLDVVYKDLRPVGSAVVPHAWQLTRMDREPRESLIFTATDVLWNGPPLPAEAFELEPPPGFTLLPL